MLTGCLGKVGGVLEMSGKHGQRALGATGHRQCAMTCEKTLACFIPTRMACMLYVAHLTIRRMSSKTALSKP